MNNDQETEITPSQAGTQSAKSGENLQEHGDPDPFPPEGTDDKMVRPEDTEEMALTDDEAVKATQAVIDVGLSGEGKTSADWPNGAPDNVLDDGTNKTPAGEPKPDDQQPYPDDDEGLSPTVKTVKV